MHDSKKHPIRKWFATVACGIVVAVVSGLVIWWLTGPNGLISQSEDREKLADEFLSKTTEYVEFAKKAWLDVIQRDYDDENKSKNQRRWEDELWPQFKIVLKKVEEKCSSPEVLAAISKLRCANTKYYYLYDSIEEDQNLSQEVDLERLREDCGTDQWRLLESDVSRGHQEISKIFSGLYGELSRRQREAVGLVNSWAGF